MAPVDVAKDVETGLYAPYLAKKMAIAETKVAMMFRRTMGDENIRLRGNFAEPRLSFIGVLKGKFLRTDLWNVWDSKNGNSAALDLLHGQCALKIDQSIQVRLGTRANILFGSALGIEPAIVVTRDDDLYRVRLRAEPIELLLDVGDGASVGEVASVDEDVAPGNIDGEVMRV